MPPRLPIPSPARLLRLIAVTVLCLYPFADLFPKDAPLPEIVVPFFTKAPILSGKLDDPAWNSAAKIHLQDFWNQKGHTLEDTEVFILCTSRCIYVGFKATDRDIVAIHRPHDDPVHHDDCVEAFFAPPVDSPEEAAGWEINALGDFADLLNRPGGWQNSGWSPRDVRILTSRQPQPPADGGLQGYTVEIEIPWTVLCRLWSLPEPPKKLRGNFARWDRGTAGSIFTDWVDPQTRFPDPHNMARYGWLIFQKQPSASH